VLSDKRRNEKLVIIDELKFKTHKTKDTLKALGKFPFGKLLIVDDRKNQELMLSTRNLPHVKAIDFSEINVFDSLKYDTIMFSVDSVQKLIEVLK